MNTVDQSSTTSAPKKSTMLLLLVLGFLLAVGAILFVLYSRSSQGMSKDLPPIRQGQPQAEQNETPAVPETMEQLEGQVIPGMPPIPVFPNVTVEKSFKRTIGQDTEYYVVWMADTTVGEIISFYETALTQDGWTITTMPEERNETGDESIVANKNNMRLMFTLEREAIADPTEIIADLYIKNN